MRAGRRLFAFDRAFDRRFVAGADEAGRGSLAGPLVAAAVLFDLERLLGLPELLKLPPWGVDLPGLRRPANENIPVT